MSVCVHVIGYEDMPDPKKPKMLITIKLITIDSYSIGTSNWVFSLFSTFFRFWCYFANIFLSLLFIIVNVIQSCFFLVSTASAELLDLIEMLKIGITSDIYPKFDANKKIPSLEMDLYSI